MRKRLRSRLHVLGGLTWTICRGCTDSVGKFPRPWIGTLSARMESKRHTWSQHSTLRRRPGSSASPEDMTVGLDWTDVRREERRSATRLPGKAHWKRREREAPLLGQRFGKLLRDGNTLRNVRHVPDRRFQPRSGSSLRRPGPRLDPQLDYSRFLPARD